MKEEIKWIDKYLLNKDHNENEAFKRDSPLAHFIQLEKAENYIQWLNNHYRKNISIT
ncbi:hypothetical protein ACG2LH_05880 [Zhouia sp. PK063]|uniref:hypothetical protein n=1 Tax=Zhouia sp. PK063 TaxID=3373602 RepID=UPI00379C6B75